MEDTQATYQHQQISGEMVEEEVVVELGAKQEKEEEDGTLLLPAHLSDSLQKLGIYDCSKLSLMASPTLPDGHKRIGSRGGEGESLQALRTLEELKINRCPKLLSAYKTSSVFSCCCPFPSSLRCLSLSNVEGMETFEPLSNLTSLTELYIDECGEDLRWEGLWPLHTRGQLSDLYVYGSPNFFVVSDPSPSSFKLRKLGTDDVAGVLVAPVCTLLSSSLTELVFNNNQEAERFTKEQEEALHLLTSLQKFRFIICNKLQCLPAGLNKLTNLKTLYIFGCQALRSLPKDGLPSSLQKLEVLYCRNKELKQRCRRLMGTIPKIRLKTGD